MCKTAKEVMIEVEKSEDFRETSIRILCVNCYDMMVERQEWLEAAIEAVEQVQKEVDQG